MSELSFESSLNNLSPDVFEKVLKYGRESNTIGKYVSKDYTQLPYGIVRKDVLNLVDKGKITDAIHLILSCQYKKVELHDVSGNEMLAFTLWMRKQSERLVEIEKTYLSSEPNIELAAAGISKLDEFGAYVVIDDLSGGDILKHPEIEKLPYFKVYEKLKLEKVKNEIKKAHNKIIEEKAKQK